MIEQGMVVGILNNNLARVEFTSTAGCKKCGICKMMGDKVFVGALNEIGAKLGERWKLRSSLKAFCGRLSYFLSLRSSVYSWAIMPGEFSSLF